jgi:hypothetical protein
MTFVRQALFRKWRGTWRGSLLDNQHDDAPLARVRRIVYPEAGPLLARLSTTSERAHAAPHTCSVGPSSCR